MPAPAFSGPRPARTNKPRIKILLTNTGPMPIINLTIE